jgi:hypothetical protein
MSPVHEGTAGYMASVQEGSSGLLKAIWNRLRDRFPSRAATTYICLHILLDWPLISWKAKALKIGRFRDASPGLSAAGMTRSHSIARFRLSLQVWIECKLFTCYQDSSKLARHRKGAEVKTAVRNQWTCRTMQLESLADL